MSPYYLPLLSGESRILVGSAQAFVIRKLTYDWLADHAQGQTPSLARQWEVGWLILRLDFFPIGGWMCITWYDANLYWLRMVPWGPETWSGWLE